MKKRLVVHDDQAQTVRLMYFMLLSGSTTAEIADTLTELGCETGGRKSDSSANTRWTSSGVTSVLRNERYCGYVLARKTWTPNFHDHKSIKNRGKKNKYYQRCYCRSKESATAPFCPLVIGMKKPRALDG